MMTVPARGSLSGSATVVRAVSVIMETVVGLTFLFGFGNVLSLALRQGVPVWVAPLVAPAVDLSILGLLLGTRHLALAGASPDVLRPARQLLIFACAVTLALNVAEPLVTGEYGKAAFDAVGPLLKAAEQEREKLDNSASAQFGPAGQVDGRPVMVVRSLAALLERVRQEDAAHRATHQRPISADKLRVRLRIGAGRARRLVRIVRAEYEADMPVAV
jgi:hypothetical protein